MSPFRRLLRPFVCFVFLVLVAVPALGKSSLLDFTGKTWTLIIAGGAVVLYEFGYQLPSDNKKIKSAWADAENTIKAPQFDSEAVVKLTVSTSPPDVRAASTLVVIPAPDEGDSSARPAPQFSVGPCFASPAPGVNDCYVSDHGTSLVLNYQFGGEEAIQEIRAKVIQTVILTPKSQSAADPTGHRDPSMDRLWRLNYTTLSSCWNRLIYADPSPTASSDGSSSKDSANDRSAENASPAKSGGASTTTPTPFENSTIKKTSCAYPVLQMQQLEGRDDYAPGIVSQGKVAAIYVDLTDAAASFDNVPSLRQQIIDRRVGPYEVDDVARAEVLAKLAGAFYAFNPALRPVITVSTPTPKPAESPTIEDLIGFQTKGTPSSSSTPAIIGVLESCQAPFDITKCPNAIVGLEAPLEGNIATKNACAFAASYWLPPVSTIAKYFPSEMYQSTISHPTPSPSENAALLAAIKKKDFGPVPGC